LAHIRSFVLGPTEPIPKVQAEEAQVEEFTNLPLDHGKPQCI
jgi:hypothetical protein